MQKLKIKRNNFFIINKKKMIDLHAIVIQKSNFKPKEALKIALDISHKDKIKMRETNESWRFDNIPKTRFEPKSFRTKIIKDGLSLIFGKIKEID